MESEFIAGGTGEAITPGPHGASNMTIWAPDDRDYGYVKPYHLDYSSFEIVVRDARSERMVDASVSQVPEGYQHMLIGQFLLDLCHARWP